MKIIGLFERLKKMISFSSSGETFDLKIGKDLTVSVERKKLREVFQNINEEIKKIRDKLINPEYYRRGVEIIDLILSWGLDVLRGNVVKYIARLDAKGDLLGDLKKAVWYLEKYIGIYGATGGQIRLSDVSMSLEKIVFSLDLNEFSIKILELIFKGKNGEALEMIKKILILLEKGREIISNFDKLSDREKIEVCYNILKNEKNFC